MPMSTYDATRALLDALDVIEADSPTACEQAIEQAIKSMARRAGLDAHTLWLSACEVEQDPIERHRPRVGKAFKPVMR